MAVTALMLLLLAGATQLPKDSLSQMEDRLSEACSPLLPSKRSSNERNASTALKMLTSAQADFRANDRDRDGVNQFWRADVAGLYALVPRGSTEIQLIPISTALADARPSGIFAPYGHRKPEHGYWFRAMRHADEDPKHLDPNRFAFIAYPATPAAGKYVYIIDENNSLWRSPAEGFEEFDVYPTDEQLKMRWSRAG